MKSFGGARPYIFVDRDHIRQAKRWLLGHQRPDGCIRSVGKLFHNGMKVKTQTRRLLSVTVVASVTTLCCFFVDLHQGGVSDDVSLTAYITAALLELDSATSVSLSLISFQPPDFLPGRI